MQGGTFSLWVRGISVFSIALGITGWSQAAVPNDDFEQAISIQLLEGTLETGGKPYFRLESSTEGASLEKGEQTNADLAAYAAHGTIWWKWEPEFITDARFQLKSSECETMLGVFTGTQLTDLVTVASPQGRLPPPGQGNLRAGFASFRGYPGQTYYLAVMGHPESSLPFGNFEGTGIFQVLSDLSSDLFENRLDLGSGSMDLRGNNFGATLEPWEESLGEEGVQHSLWYIWRATEDGLLFIEIVESTPDGNVFLTPYRGSTPGTLEPLPELNERTYLVRKGDPVQLQVACKENPYDPQILPGPFFLQLVFTSLPAHEDFSNRIVIEESHYRFQNPICERTRKWNREVWNPANINLSRGTQNPFGGHGRVPGSGKPMFTEPVRSFNPSTFTPEFPWTI